MMDRRTFLGQMTAAGVVASARLGGVVRAMTLPAIGVQLYTARGEMQKDVEGTLAKIAAIGYTQVEFAGYFDKSPQEIRQILDRHNLTAPSTHIDLTTISTKLPSAIETCRVIGHRYIVMPYLDDATRAQPDAFAKVAETLNKAGAETKKAGIQLAYHNHNFEFAPVNGVLPFETLMKTLDPDLVKMELDICWATSAKQDPAALFARYPGRFAMVHLKGLRKVPDQGAAAPIPQVLPDVTDVGGGGDVIDWKAVLVACADAKIDRYFVEHDQPADPFASLTASYTNLKRLTA